MTIKSLKTRRAPLALMSGCFAGWMLAAAHGQDAGREHPNAAAALRETPGTAVASDEKRNVGYYTGRSVRDSAGQEIGRLEDFLANSGTGKIAYGVVSSNGTASHVLRLAPIESVHWEQADESFRVNIMHDEWEQVPPINEEHYSAGNIVTGAEDHPHQRRLSGDRRGADSIGVIKPDLIRISTLPGRVVYSGEEPIGRIEELLVDLEDHHATVVLAPHDKSSDPAGMLLVPFARLAVQPNQDRPVMTTLTRAEIQAVQRAAGSMAAGGELPQTDITGASGISQSSVRGQAAYSSAQSVEAATTEKTRAGIINEEVLTPTGRTSADQNPRADSGLLSAAQAIRKALDSSALLAKAEIEVLPHDGRLVLRGSVEGEALKKLALETASRAAPGFAMENRLSLRNR